MSLPAPVRYYTTKRAPNPRRTDIFIAEKGIELATTELNLMAGEHKQAAYAGKAGVAQVPALELADGTWLLETQAICRYLEALHPEPNLMGSGAAEVAEVEMWQRQAEFRLFVTIAQAFRHTNPRMAALETQCPDWGALNADRIDDRLAEFDRRLTARDFLALDRFTVADITALVAVDFLKVLGRQVPSSLAHLTQWHARVRTRPSTTL